MKTGVMAAVFVAATGLVCAQGAPAVQPATPGIASAARDGHTATGAPRRIRTTPRDGAIHS